MTKNCELCQTSTKGEEVVHKSCHESEVAEQAKVCVECEHAFDMIDAEASFDLVLAELRRQHLPYYRLAT